MKILSIPVALKRKCLFCTYFPTYFVFLTGGEVVDDDDDGDVEIYAPTDNVVVEEEEEEEQAGDEIEEVESEEGI